MKIIIADDIFTNRLLVSEIVKCLGHELIQVENGKKAIEALENNSDIDLVFMDIEMPVMNGLEATRHIREKLTPPKNSVPVIALTAHNPRIFFEDYKDVGFDQLLTKPYSVEKITQLLKSYEK